MAIAVSCKQCGKSFKAKDELAGRAVRCPGCHSPLKIPSAAPAAITAHSSPGAKPGAAKPASNAGIDAALAKVEAARQKRAAEQAEIEAKKDEVLKLAEEFDKVSPKAMEAEKKAKKEGPPQKVGEKPKKVTTMTRIADVFGMIKSSAPAKIILLTLFIVGGGTGSALFIRRIMSATHEATRVEKVDDAGIDKLYADAEKAADAGNWSRVRDCLEDIIRAQPYRKNNFRYKALKERLEKAFGGGG